MSLAKPWENNPGSSPATAVTASTTNTLTHKNSASGAGTSNFSDALTTLPTTTETTQNTTDSSQQAVSGVNTTNSTNWYTPGYNSGLGYSRLGMGSMYGGLGMGSMYSGLGMGGMYGGLGMMGGMYGGLGMMGGMSEDFQRGQMTFMLVGRLLEMCGMFAGVIQMTFGSALQFMGSYIGMSQQYNQLKSGMYMDESGKWVQVPKRSVTERHTTGISRKRKFMNRKRGARAWVGILRRLAFLLLAVFISRRIIGHTAARHMSQIRS